MFCILGSVGHLACAFEVTTASTKSFQGHGFHCEFVGESASQRILFNDGGVSSSGALIGIDGNSVLLTQRKLRWSPARKDGPKVNDRLHAIFKGDSTSMVITAVVRKGCGGMPESCERWQYATTIAVTHRGASKTLKGISECGA